MTPQEFKSIWKESEGKLSPIRFERLRSFSLLPTTSDFLVISGLPEDASPFLSFVNDSDHSYYGINKLTNQYDFMYDDHKYDKYVVIGSCRDGDPIAIDTSDQDTIVELDHEDLFNSMFFNSSIGQLAHFLIFYQDFELSVLAEHGKERARAGYFTDLQFESLRDKMMAIDKRALVEQGFWKEELDIILDHRQKYMDFGPSWLSRFHL